MLGFLIVLAVAMAASAIGFKKYIWFISIGYGFAIAAIGIALFVMFHGRMDAGLVAVCILLIIYGCRLGGYLAYRELKITSYGKKMVGEIKDGSNISLGVHCAIWVSAALLYACQTAPVLFRLENLADAAGGEAAGSAAGAAAGTDGFVIAGLILAVIGVAMEVIADYQKNRAKKIDPGRFVDTGLFRFVRCPNYLGELALWTGIFIMGFGAGMSVIQWVACIAGYLGIIYVMFSGARRLEMRQIRTYGDDPEYIRYSTTVPIMIPFIPLYSVEKYKWFVA